MNRWTKQHGSYYLTAPNGDIQLMTDEPAILFDQSNGTLLKIGARDWVENYARTFRREVLDQDASLFDPGDLVIMSGVDWDPEDLNRCLSTAGYCLALYNRLEQEGADRTVSGELFLTNTPKEG